MKHFTPELYEQFNSHGVDLADAADVRWDLAQTRSKARLGQIRQSLPPSVKVLANELCLHDAELVHLAADDAEAFIQARHRNALHILSYRLKDAARIGSPRRSAAFSDAAIRWIYDKVDLRKQGVFSYDILLSNGQEIELVFDDVRIESFEVHPLGTSQKLDSTNRILE
ncbi:MAG TPA: hypothetical protein VGX76_09385 [Pirellulales bacterium]|nr:hypothetical protein [Pirellulales bacterium]